MDKLLFIDKVFTTNIGELYLSGKIYLHEDINKLTIYLTTDIGYVFIAKMMEELCSSIIPEIRILVVEDSWLYASGLHVTKWNTLRLEEKHDRQKPS